MAAKTILSSFIVLLNISIVFLFNNNNKKLWGTVGLISIFTICFFNNFYEIRSLQVLTIILMFSFAIVIGFVFNRFTENRYKSLVNENAVQVKTAKLFLHVKNIFFHIVIPIILTIYQLMMICSDKLSNEIMSQSEPSKVQISAEYK